MKAKITLTKTLSQDFLVNLPEGISAEQAQEILGANMDAATTLEERTSPLFMPHELTTFQVIPAEEGDPNASHLDDGDEFTAALKRDLGL